MFFILSKILDILLSPTVWILIPLAIALMLKKVKQIKIAVLCSIFILFLMTNATVCNYFLQRWEIDTPDIGNGKSYTWGILLTGGMIKYSDTHPERISTGEVADRMIQTFHLYQQGAIKKILITGGETSIPHLMTDKSNESVNVKRLLIKMGVPARDIFVENKARNTYENALYSSQMLKKYIEKDTVVLITSAMHLRRSILCFEKQGFKVRPYAADILKKDTPQGILSYLKPSEKSLQTNFQLLREIVGMIVYKLQGYI
ncbi:YdcF family protein [Aquirufa ecclesiirivi]|uniref:YdcF family protein n=1 Tax=Aquirufa ecclesiirivi TaxID=2715124 RepID=UPI0022A81580|nr:YdcF family protein [Aquirufa ecclesiirivi]MCZ2472216.1 YdcF family protein [Aquirufa ecclesiirivi]